jgi:hypothetical protein
MFCAFSRPSLCSEDAEILQEECRHLNQSNAELLEEVGYHIHIRSAKLNLDNPILGTTASSTIPSS